MKAATQICHKHVNFGVRCLSTFLTASDTFVDELAVFGDGSLTKTDKDIIKKISSKVILYDKSKWHSIVNKELRKYDNIKTFLNWHWAGVKLFVIPCVIKGEYFYVDSDVLFFQRFMLNNVKNFDIVYQYDNRSAYSINYFRTHFNRDVNLVQNLNSGLMYVGLKGYDPDYVNWFLGERLMSGEEWLMEQTVWGAVAGRVRSGYWNRSQFKLASSNTVVDSHTVAVHYIKIYREQLFKVTNNNNEYRVYESGVREIEIKDAQRKTIFNDTFWRIKRRLGLSHDN